ncbi:MAG: cation:proton antiporter [Candidatus Micrarchaeota archaeon]
MGALGIEFSFFLIGTIILLGFVGELIFRRTNVPDVLLLLLLGLLLGPVTGAINPQNLIAIAPLFAPIALMVLLFDGGLRMNIYKVLHGSPRAALLTFLGVTFSIILTAVVMRVAFGWGTLAGALLGAIVGGTSSAIILPIVQRIKMGEKTSDLLSLESVMTDVLCIVVTLSLLQTAISGSLGADSIQYTIKEVLGTFAVGGLFGLIAGVVWLEILKKFKGLKYGYMLTLAILFVLYAISEIFGGSGAIAALIFGLSLGNGVELSNMFKLKENVEIEDDSLKLFQSEVSFFIRTFFFVYLGSVVVISNYLLVAVGALLSLLLFGSRYVAARLSTIANKQLSADKEILTIMCSRGLAAAVLAQIVVNTPGAPMEAKFYPDLVFVVIIATVVLTSAGVTVWSRKRKAEEEKGKEKTEASKKPASVQAPAKNHAKNGVKA